MKIIKSKIIPLPRSDIDTDLIIPADFLKITTKEGLGQHVFERLRATDADFPFNLERYQGGQILVSRRNFGCGSSREHAVWALVDWGIRVVIAPSFSDIFHSNAMKNGLLPIILDEEIVEKIFEEEKKNSGKYEVKVDLPNQTITFTDGRPANGRGRGRIETFKMDPYRKECLIKGMNDLDYLLSNMKEIQDFDKKHAKNIFFDTSIL